MRYVLVLDGGAAIRLRAVDGLVDELAAHPEPSDDLAPRLVVHADRVRFFVGGGRPVCSTSVDLRWLGSQLVAERR